MSAAKTNATHAQQTVTACMNAYTYAYQAAVYCTHTDGLRDKLDLIRLLFDAAEMNLAFANSLARGSNFHADLGVLCFRITDACTDALSSVEHNDALLRTAFAATAGACRALALITGKRDYARYDVVDETSCESFPASDPPGYYPQGV